MLIGIIPTTVSKKNYNIWWIWFNSRYRADTSKQWCVVYWENVLDILDIPGRVDMDLSNLFLEQEMFTHEETWLLFLLLRLIVNILYFIIFTMWCFCVWKSNWTTVLLLKKKFKALIFSLKISKMGIDISFIVGIWKENVVEMKI